MAHPAALDRLVADVAAQVRWRRAEHYALRGVFYGALAALVPLVGRTLVGPLALPIAGGLVVLAALAGLACGLVRRVPAADAARLADRAFGLEDRLTTALEWAARADRTPLVDLLIADAVAHVGAVRPRQIVPRVLPREARLLPMPVLAALVLVLAPALPLPSRLPDFSRVAGPEEETQERAGTAMTDEGTRTLPRDQIQYPMLQQRDFVPRGANGGSATAGDQSAVFKDTSLASQRPDFNSFVKKGGDRLKLLDRTDRIPDLASDYTGSQYRMMFKKSKALTSGLRPDQVSPKKLRELLDEMQKLGKKDGDNWSSDAAEGMEALDSGQQDRALEAMEKALGKMREAEDRQRAGKGLKGGRESGAGAGQRDRKGGQGGGQEDQGSDGEGLLPGKGKSGAPKGEATQRLRTNPYDASVEGEARRGRKDAYDTNMTGRGGQMASRLPNLGVIGQYRKMMEDAIAREQIPRDYHTQIRDYFQALDER